MLHPTLCADCQTEWKHMHLQNTSGQMFLGHAKPCSTQLPKLLTAEHSAPLPSPGLDRVNFGYFEKKKHT